MNCLSKHDEICKKSKKCFQTWTRFSSHKVNFVSNPIINVSLSLRTIIVYFQTLIFREMSMSKEEHKKVVSVLCHRLSNMQPNELPPLVHQLLALCRHQHAAIIVTALCKYFQTQYAKLNDDDSEQYSEDISAHESSILIFFLSIQYLISTLQDIFSG